MLAQTENTTPAGGHTMDMPVRISGLRTFTTMISPARAMEILEHLNWSRQRDVSQHWVGVLRMARLKGQLTFLTLVYAELPDGSWVLVDGQHRLWALSDLDQAIPAVIIVYEVGNERQLESLYLTFDRAKRRGPDVALKAKNVLQKTERPDLVKRMNGAIPLLSAAFSPSYRADAGDLEDRSDASAEWLPWMESYIRLISSGAVADQRRMMRSSVAAVALATLRYAPSGRAEEFWSRAATQEMLTADDPRMRLMAFLREDRRQYGNQRGAIREVTYCAYVAAAWNAYFEGRTLKILKASEPVKILGTPYGTGRRAP